MRLLFLLIVLSSSSVLAADCTDEIQVPEGYCAQVFHPGVGRARHMVIDEDGDLYVRLRSPQDGVGIVALRDSDGDGVADTQAGFEDSGGTGLLLLDGQLYASTAHEVFRYRLAADDLRPSGARQTVIADLPGGHSHDAKSLAADAEGWLYVNHGSPSNACQASARSPGSPGLDPCPQLATEAGVWRFRADRLDQRFADGERFATGIRNSVAIDHDPVSGAVYVVQHGRDQLDSLWSERYDAAANAELPAEELFRLEPDGDYGWPYCYYDPMAASKRLAPEYGGDGEVVGRCEDALEPVAAYPAHWAPNDLLFPSRLDFPAPFDRGAFIAFHGSWNRAPLPQAGYQVGFQPLDGSGEAAGDYVAFATGFPQRAVVRSSGQARWRPMGLADGPDGALYVVDSREGRIWRISAVD